MKRTFLLLAVAWLGGVSAVAQGKINFNNYVSGVFNALIYGLEPGDPSSERHAGTVDISPFGGPVFNGPLLAGTGFTIQLWGHVGTGIPTSSLTLLASTTFRTGGGAGRLNVAMLPGGSAEISVPNAPLSQTPLFATVQVRAWDNLGGTITDWAQVQASPQVPRGESEIITTGILGGTGSPPATTPDLIGMTSFNLHIASVPGGLFINSILLAEGTNGTVNANLAVRLTSPSDQVILVDYASADGTALAGSDYEAASGTLTFLPGETSKTVTVVLTSDVGPEPDESFTVILSNPVNGILLRSVGLVTITETRITGLAVDVSISFHTVIGHIYRLEKTDVLMTQPWTPIAGATSIVGTGGDVTALDRGAGCDAGRIYRARLLQ